MIGFLNQAEGKGSREKLDMRQSVWTKETEEQNTGMEVKAGIVEVAQQSWAVSFMKEIEVGNSGGRGRR